MEITKEYLQSLVKDPIPEASEFYYPDNDYYGEHKAYYNWRNDLLKEIISNME